MSISRSQIIITFMFLLLASIAGILLRFQLYEFSLAIQYKYLLHTHSHIALLGWVYNALYIAICYQFLPLNTNHQKYDKLFWLTQVTIVGMLFSFPLQGYAFVSITFSTLFLFASYTFAYFIFKDLKKGFTKPNVSALFIKFSLAYLVISSIGPWGLGMIMATGNSDSIWYNLAIYFYLHFLYNGFVVFALFGLVIKYIEINIDQEFGSKSYKVFILMNISVVPAYLLSTLYLNPPLFIFIIAGIAAFLQLLALGYFLRILFYRKLKPIRISLTMMALLYGVLISYILKVGMQLLSSFPSIAEMAYGSRHYTVIAYLHLVMLGFITLALIAWVLHYYFLTETGIWFRMGSLLLITGILISETLLFGQGISTFYFYKGIPEFTKYMFYASLLMPVGLLFITLDVYLFKPAPPI